MDIRFKCACGHGLKAPAEMAGRRGKCPACGQVFVVPAAVEGSAPSSAAQPAIKPLPSNNAPAKAAPLLAKPVMAQSATPTTRPALRPSAPQVVFPSPAAGPTSPNSSSSSSSSLGPQASSLAPQASPLDDDEYRIAPDPQPASAPPPLPVQPAPSGFSPLTSHIAEIARQRFETNQKIAAVERAVAHEKHVFIKRANAQPPDWRSCASRLCWCRWPGCRYSAGKSRTSRSESASRSSTPPSKTRRSPPDLTICRKITSSTT